MIAWITLKWFLLADSICPPPAKPLAIVLITSRTGGFLVWAHPTQPPILVSSTVLLESVELDEEIAGVDVGFPSECIFPTFHFLPNFLEGLLDLHNLQLYVRTSDDIHTIFFYQHNLAETSELVAKRSVQ